MLAGCRVKDIDQPALAGPSTFAHALTLTAEQTSLTLGGPSVNISIASRDPMGQSERIPVRVDVVFNGSIQDHGTLSAKQTTTPDTIRYTPPSANSPAGVVTILVTPNVSGDFRQEFARQLDLNLMPQGVIVPREGNSPNFTVSPNPALVLQTVAFDASSTFDSDGDGEQDSCRTGCSFSWNFGDGNTATGIRPFHIYRTQGTYLVTLVVTDGFGAQTARTASIVVNPSTPPTVSFTTSPSSPGVDQPIFFNATASRPAPGRTIVLFDWDFGDGNKASGMTTSHTYIAAQTYTVTLRVTDDAGAIGQQTATLIINTTNGLPTADFIFSPSTAQPANTQIFFDASASRPFTSNAPIVEYRWDFGDGSPDVVGPNARATKIFGRGSATYQVRLTVTDSLGRRGTTTRAVQVQ